MVALTVEQQRLVEENLGLVTHIAKRTNLRLAVFDHDDAVSAGIVGLSQAALRYKMDSEFSFGTFCGRRVAGAIKDEFRALSWMTRNDLRDLVPGEERQVLSLDAVHRDNEDPGADFIPDPTIDAEFENVDNSGEYSFVREAVKQLPPLEAEIITRVFFKGEKNRCVAASLGVTESRTCQVKARALKHLRDIIEQGAA